MNVKEVVNAIVAVAKNVMNSKFGFQIFLLSYFEVIAIILLLTR